MRKKRIRIFAPCEKRYSCTRGRRPLLQSEQKAISDAKDYGSRARIERRRLVDGQKLAGVSREEKR
jgi:hypothetical protein